MLPATLVKYFVNHTAYRLQCCVMFHNTLLKKYFVYIIILLLTSNFVSG